MAVEMVKYQDDFKKKDELETRLIRLLNGVEREIVKIEVNGFGN